MKSRSALFSILLLPNPGFARNPLGPAVRRIVNGVLDSAHWKLMEGRRGALALVPWLVLGSLVAQGGTWTFPFNHNQPHNGNGTFSDPFGPWKATPQHSMLPISAPAGTVFQNFGWPAPGTNGQSFNAVHMSLIPKGRYRGMVLVWDIVPVLAAHPTGQGLPTGQWMSFQACAVVDPAPVPTVTDPLATGNQAFRYRNFLLPMGVFQPGTPGLEPQNLFCSGHAWSPFGDLIVVGGTEFYSSPTPFNGEVITMAFNPRLDFAAYPGTTWNPYSGFVGMWKRGPDLQDMRWYPTATLTHRFQRTIAPGFPDGREVMVVTGGSFDDNNSPTHNIAANNPQWNTYEGLVIDHEAASAAVGYSSDFVTVGTTPVFLWPGPGSPPPNPNVEPPVEVDWLYEYPRVHLLSTGRLFFSGYAPRYATMDHDASPGVWVKSGGQPLGTFSSNWNHRRTDGASFLFPNFGGVAMDIVYRLGGCDEHWYLPFVAGDIGSPNGTTATMESIHASVPNATWQAAPSMPTTNGTNGGRFLTNAVILPTGAVLVVGGMHRAPNTTAGLAGLTPVYHAQLFENGNWTTLSQNPMASKRDYHSSAILLEDGRVFIGGGNIRDYDYEIYSPPYLSLPRPTGVAFNPPPPFHPDLEAWVLNYGGEYSIEWNYSPEFAVSKAVLMAPCSTTHSSDMSQRYFEMVPGDLSSNTIGFTAPPDDKHVPRGIYMLFLVTAKGGISKATWVVLR